MQIVVDYKDYGYELYLNVFRLFERCLSAYVFRSLGESWQVAGSSWQ